ncbi:MAG: GNAT family N-acetyltransferase [Caulobacteraceae bacterium]|nr:GNAT family N-acetyltransferase [Caulobacteraceae bacterium]
MDIVALEKIAARAWPAVEEARLGGWLLRAASGHTGRANSCWALEPPDRPVDEAISAVESWYAARGLTPLFRTTDGATAPVDLAERLASRGYVPEIETMTMTGPLTMRPDAQVCLSQASDARFREVLFGVQHRGDGDAQERLEVLSRIPAPVAFARLDVDGGPASVGVCAVAGDWAGLSAMRTLDRARRQGLARRVVGALHAFAAEAGASRAYLQVEAENLPAIALYRSLGFTPAFNYRHWRRR